MNLNFTEFVIAVIVIPWGESCLIVASLRKNASKEGNKMAEQIRAEEGAIEKGATAVDNARSGIENRIKDIEAKMAELGSFWSGDAAVSFNALMSSWQEKATSLNNILIDLSDNLRGTAKDQAANEEDNQSRTSKLQALLG